MRATALALAAAQLFASAAAADAPLPTGRFQLGPLHLTPRLELKNAGIDTNVLNSSVDPVRDTTVVLSPGLELITLVKNRARLTAFGSLDWNYFRDSVNERSLDWLASGRADWTGGFLSLHSLVGANRSKQRFSPDLDARVPHTERWFSAGLDARITPKIAMTANGELRGFTFDNYLVDGQNIKWTLDRDRHSGSIELRYAVTPLTTLLLSATAIQDDFRYPPRGVVTSFRYLGGFELSRYAFIKGVVLAGLRDFPETTARSAPAYRGPAFLIRTRTPVLKTAQIGLFAERDVYYAAAGGSSSDLLRNTFVRNSYQAELSVELPLRLLGRVYTRFDKSLFLAPPAAGTLERLDHSRSIGGALLRRLGDQLRLGLAVEWVKRTSNYAGYDYKGLRYGIQGELAP